ncbi:Uncharacterized protein FWK35_00029470 [Aphis craccivora]|uniref:Uncharacterized protein n=1 Tax=Aphis craccivora TaxID=307492 RepID=A0A6G0YU71_APHCR|nr:Uncharacterized protein FWK35_00029470 [Aphis craccivora]
MVTFVAINTHKYHVIKTFGWTFLEKIIRVACQQGAHGRLLVFAARESVAIVAQETVVSNNSATTIVGDFYKLLNPTSRAGTHPSRTHNYSARAMFPLWVKPEDQKLNTRELYYWYYYHRHHNHHHRHHNHRSRRQHSKR